MAEEKEPMDDKDFGDHLFEAMYPMPHPDYDEKTMLQDVLTAEEFHRWKQFCQVLETQFQGRIELFHVPLAWDDKNELWWIDYADDYISRKNLNPRNLPCLIVIIKLDDSNTRFDIEMDEGWFRIQHRNLSKALGEEFRQVMAEASFATYFKWDGTKDATIDFQVVPCVQEEADLPINRNLG